MQRNSQPPQAQRPAARPQQPYSSPGQRPAARPAQPAQNAARPVSGVQRQTPVGANRPANGNQIKRPVQQRPAGHGAPQRPAPVQRPSSAVRSEFTGRRDNRPMIITAIGIVLTIVIGCLMQYVVYPAGYFPDKTVNAVETVAEIASSRGVRINEVMTSNKTALSDSTGAYPDWIELINASGETVDITGWSLLDKASRTTYFSFPEYSLAPGETVLVYASGHFSSEAGSDFNAPFRLSSSGDTLMLSDSHSTVVESINIPALGANQSYARKDGGWSVTSEYTPGLENTTLNYAALTSTQPIGNSPLLITEVMADNASYPAADGALYDWIEVYNASASAIDLKGYALSDTPDKPAQWKFPSIQLQPGQYLIVYTSGMDQQTADGALHTNFGLRAEGESVLLYNAAGQVLDHVEYDNLKSDQSLKRQADGSYTTSGTASPGRAN